MFEVTPCTKSHPNTLVSLKTSFEFVFWKKAFLTKQLFFLDESVGVAMEQKEDDDGAEEINVNALFRNRARRRPGFSHKPLSTTEAPQPPKPATVATTHRLTLPDDDDDDEEDDMQESFGKQKGLKAFVRRAAVSMSPATTSTASAAATTTVSYDAEELERLRRETYRAPPPQQREEEEEERIEVREDEAEVEADEEPVRDADGFQVLPGTQTRVLRMEGVRADTRPSLDAVVVDGSDSDSDSNSEDEAKEADTRPLQTLAELRLRVAGAVEAARAQAAEDEKALEHAHAAQTEAERALQTARTAQQTADGEHEYFAGLRAFVLGAGAGIARIAPLVERTEREVMDALSREADAAILARHGAIVTEEEHEEEHGDNTVERLVAEMQSSLDETRDADCWDVAALLARMYDWRTTHRAAYEQAFVSLSLPVMLAPHARCEMLRAWHTLCGAPWPALRSMAWVRACTDYAAHWTPLPGSDGDDRTLVAALIDRTALPRAKHYVDRCWDPLVLRTHVPTLALVQDVLACSGSDDRRNELLGAVCGALEGALARMSVAAPASVPALLACYTRWVPLINPGTAQRIIVEKLVLEKALPLLRTGALDPVHSPAALVQALPTTWTTATVPLLGALAAFIRDNSSTVANSTLLLQRLSPQE